MRILCVVSMLGALVATSSAQAQGEGKSAPAFPETPTMVKAYRGSTADAVWKSVDGVYQKLRIKTTMRSAGQRILANPAFPIQKELGAFKLAELFDCGTNADGPIAANAPLVLSVKSSVKSLESGTVLSTWIEAHAAPVPGEPAPQFTCRSLGKLEEELQPDKILVFTIVPKR
ncbi:MAG: hypothetical protein ABI852_09900 [Gemmatimonadaceae bacterium]